MVPRGVYINDIPRYVAPMQGRNLTKNQRYTPKLSPLPEGMTCLVDIIPALVKMKYEDHDLLLLKDVADEPYQSVPTVSGVPIIWIPHPWAQGLDRSRLLGLINMPASFWKIEQSECMCQILVSLLLW